MVWFTAVLMALEALKVLLGWGSLALAPAFALYDPFEHRIPEVQNEP
jgi:molybdopterin/thiamine biosynthesis adenylyltransferase